MVGTMAKIDDSVKKKVPELRFPGFTIFLKYVIIDVAINFCGDIGRIFYVI